MLSTIPPPDLHIAITTIEQSITVSLLSYKIHETDRNAPQICVESITGEGLRKFCTFHPMNPGLQYKRQMYLNELVSVDGVATDSSHSDGIIYAEINAINIGVGINELKDTAFAPVEQHGQIHATATNLCLGQLKHGLSCSECCVAFLSTNGQLYQFGFVTLLPPAFPVMHITSPVIDAIDMAGTKLAAAHLHIMREFCRAQDRKLRSCATPAAGKIYVALDEQIHYQKPVNKLFKRCNTHIQSLLNMYKIFQKLHDNKVDVAVLPVAIRSGVLNERDYMCHDVLIFPMLDSEFQMGVPQDNVEFSAYIKELKRSYKLMHAAGVVHVDGYPSNILWKKDINGAIVIRFVDFDAASVIDQPFDLGIHELLNSAEYCGSFYYWGGDALKARAEHDAWFVYLYSLMTTEEKADSYAAGQRKNIHGINTEYWKLVHRIRQNPTLTKDFQSWFDSHW